MTVKIVLLGSINHGPYEVLVPYPFKPELFYSSPEQHEEVYKIACETFYPAIQEADAVIVWAPDGVKPGSHTLKDIEYAEKAGNKVIYLQGKKP